MAPASAWSKSTTADRSPRHGRGKLEIRSTKLETKSNQQNETSSFPSCTWEHHASIPAVELRVEAQLRGAFPSATWERGAACLEIRASDFEFQVGV